MLSVFILAILIIALLAFLWYGWKNLEQPRPTSRTRIPLQPSGFLTSGCFGIAI